MNERVLWLDFETTGLSLLGDEVLEIGLVVTERWDEIAAFEAVREHSWLDDHTLMVERTRLIDEIDPVVRKMHTDSGLFARGEFGKKWNGIEQGVMNFVREFMSDEKKILLAGYSVHFDRGWLDLVLPRLSKKLSHRLIDVSSIRETARIWAGYEKDPNEKKDHRALADCRAAKTELRRILDFLRSGSTTVKRGLESEVL